ncbi:MAG: ribbon-helix-helix protein, CopG family [Nitrospira sp.]|nr:ribbon-helix-helix protein, CopG family [Nitrospira sp.]
MRINARLDDARVEKLKQLKSLTRLGVSEIVKRAIDLLHRQQARRSREKLDALLSSDFVGCAEGPEDLASRYKQYLTQDLEHKHGAG